MAPGKAYPQCAVVILGVAVAMATAASALLADRHGGIDEIGLVNPAYMKLHYGKLTYPVHRQFDSMFVHPPTHYALIAAFMRLGFSLYYAQALPTLLTVLFCVVVIVRCTLPAAVKMGLLYGLAIAPTTFQRFAYENYGMRPENHLAAALLAGLVLLEWGRQDGWSKPKLFAGGAFVVFGAGMQYFAWPGVFAVGVYAAALVMATGWREALRPLAALAGGAMSTGVPYLALFVIPNIASIRGMLDSTRVTGASSPWRIHLDSYHGMANLHIGDGMVWLALWIGIPMVFISTLLLLSLRSTRVLAIAALPVQLTLLFFAWHKHPYYYYPEIQLYCAAMLAAGLMLVSQFPGAEDRLWPSALSGRADRIQRWPAPLLWYGAAALCSIHLWMAGTSYRKPHWTVQPRVHELDIARAAGREMLGPKARTGSRIGAWYSSGGAYWHDVSPALYWNPFVSTFDVTAYAAGFDAIAEYQHMSFVTRNGRGQNAASWYQNGSWQLRGFFFAEVNPEISYLLFAAKNPGPLTGYGLRQGQMFRFTEDAPGDHEFLSLACPIEPAVCTVGEVKSLYLEWQKRCPDLAGDSLFFSVIFQPEQPGRFEMDAVVNMVLPAAQGRAYAGAHPECRLIHETPGRLTPVDQQMLIAKLRREDKPMQFYERQLDMPGVPQILGVPPPEGAVRLTDAIRLDRLKIVHQKASLISSAPWKVMVPGGMGAYAASIPLEVPARDAPCWVHLRITVSKGTVALGVLSRKKRDFVVEPQAVSVGKLPVDIYIRLPSLVGADEVIVRSAEAETSSEVTLQAADVWVSQNPGGLK